MEALDLNPTTKACHAFMKTGEVFVDYGDTSEHEATLEHIKIILNQLNTKI